MILTYSEKLAETIFALDSLHSGGRVVLERFPNKT